MTMTVILKRKKVRTNIVSPLLFIMCLSNLIFSSICLPIRASQLFGWTMDESFCQYFAILYYSNIFVSMLSCALISLNRALALENYAMAKRVFSWRKTIFYYNLMWQLSVGLLLLPMYKVWGKLGIVDETHQCTILSRQPGDHTCSLKTKTPTN